MANMVFGYKNLIEAAAVSGGNWLATLPLSNIKTPVLQRLARSTNVQLASTKFQIDLGSAKGVGVLALVVHNLSVDAKVRISAADNASFVGTQGNLLSYTEDFSNALWTKDGVTLGATVTANSITLTKLIETSGTNSGNGHKVLQTIACTPASAYALSFYVRAGERSVVQQWSYGGTGSDATSAFFDTATGVATGTGSPSLTLVSPGLWRCQRTITTLAAQTSLSVGIGPSDGSGVQAYSGTGPSNVGGLTALSPAVAIGLGGGGSGHAVMSPDGKFLYAFNSSVIQIFSVSSGLLTYVASPTAYGGDFGAISFNGQFLFSVSQGQKTAYAFKRNTATGALSFVNNVVFNKDYAFRIALSPDNKNAYISTGGSLNNPLAVCNIDQVTGALTLVGMAATSLNVTYHNYVVCSSDGKNVYAFDQNNWKILVYTRDANGWLNLLESIGSNSYESLAIAPDASILVACRTGRIDVWARNAITGKLSLVSPGFTQNWPPGSICIFLAFSGDGKNLYASMINQNYVYCYAVNGATITAMSPASVAIASSSRTVVVSPDDAFVYAPHSSGNSVNQFARSPGQSYGAFAGGTQLELGSTATSYLPILGLNSNPPDYQTAWTSVWPAGMVPQTLLEWEEDNFWLGTLSAEQRSSFQSPYLHLLATQQFYRYWRVEIDDAANSAGYVQIGRVFISPIWSPAVNFAWGDELAYEDTSPSTTALSGTQYFDNRPKPRVARLKFEALSKTEALDVALQIDRTLGISGELLQVPDRADAARIPATAFLATMRQTTPVVSVLADTYTKSYELREIL